MCQAATASIQLTGNIVPQAVEKFTGMTLHDNRTLQYLTASLLDVISEGDEEGQDSDSEPGWQYHFLFLHACPRCSRQQRSSRFCRIVSVQELILDGCIPGSFKGRAQSC